jgi:hypothetical protein
MIAHERPIHRCVRQLSILFTIAVAGGLGTLAALFGTQGSGSAGDSAPQSYGNTSPSHIWPWFHQGAYTFTSSTCSGPTWIDPINLIFHGPDARWESIRYHAKIPDHGPWAVSPTGGTQYFLDHGQCEPMDTASGSASDFAPVDRWHMRYNEGLGHDPEVGLYTVAAAHHEDFVLLRKLPPWCHAVDGNESEPPGGFNMGRNELLENWVLASDTHYHTDTEYWGNIQRFQKCDGEYAWSDGWVFHISTHAEGPVLGNPGGIPKLG